MIAVYTKFPSFIARSTVRDMPGVGKITQLLNSVFVERVGEDSKESKIAAFKGIEDR